MNYLSLMSVLAADTGVNTTAGYLSMIIPLVLLVVFFYFFIYKPQKKQEKSDQKMRDSLEIGDEVITNGGIVGLVTQIKEDTVVIETGGDRSKIRIKKWAIAKVVTEKDQV
ncbi:MAG: preprotein translocase subunit YajC [Ruminococcus sp.]|nr:preprotein translocase subunit YajC [Ruminococcus sp.]